MSRTKLTLKAINPANTNYCNGSTSSCTNTWMCWSLSPGTLALLLLVVEKQLCDGNMCQEVTQENRFGDGGMRWNVAASKSFEHNLFLNTICMNSIECYVFVFTQSIFTYAALYTQATLQHKVLYRLKNVSFSHRPKVAHTQTPFYTIRQAHSQLPIQPHPVNNE